MPPKEPRPPSRFRLDLGGKEAIGIFRECTGLDSETTVIEHTSVDAQRQPGHPQGPRRVKWSNITLKRGVDENQELWNWRKQVLDEGPDSARVDGFIEMLDYNGTPIKRYKFLQGWPVKYTGVSFDPKSSDVAVEELQICHEGLQVE